MLQCQRNPAHLLYLEEGTAGRLEIPAEDPVWCPWGDDSPMLKLPGEFEIAVTGSLRETPAPTEPIPPPA